MAIFVLIGAVFLVAQMLVRSLEYGRRSAQKTLVLEVAQRTMDRIRGWAQTPANFRSDWSAWNGVSVVDPLQPEFPVLVTCNATGRALLSPCSSLEGIYAGRAIQLDRSIIPVHLEVAWGTRPTTNS